MPSEASESIVILRTLGPSQALPLLGDHVVVYRQYFTEVSYTEEVKNLFCTIFLRLKGIVSHKMTKTIACSIL